jgi:hypothetical protein
VPLQSLPDSHQYSTLASLSKVVAKTKRSNKVQAVGSNKVQPRKRRSASKDRQTIERICAFGAQPQIGSVASSVAIPTPFSTPLITPSTALKDNRLLPWERTSDEVKAFAATLALRLAGRPAHAFTFNLTPDAEAKLKRYPSRFVESLRRAFNRELERRGIQLSHCLFSVDMEWDKRLHLHGAFLADPEQLPAIREAMKAAWGRWDGPGSHKQLRIDRLYSEDWANYITRNRRRVTKMIGETITITHPLRRLAKSDYVRVCTIIGEACEIMESGIAKDAIEALELLDMGVQPMHLH